MRAHEIKPIIALAIQAGKLTAPLSESQVDDRAVVLLEAMLASANGWRMAPDLVGVPTEPVFVNDEGEKELLTAEEIGVLKEARMNQAVTELLLFARGTLVRES